MVFSETVFYIVSQDVFLSMNFYRPQTKCLRFCSQGGCLVWGGLIRGGVPGPGGLPATGGVWSRGGLVLGGSGPREVPGGNPPPPGRLLLPAVRILLECILVLLCFTFSVRNVSYPESISLSALKAHKATK